MLQAKPVLLTPIHIGRRGKLAAAAVVVIVVLGILGNVVLGNYLTTPESVAADYIGAVGSNNADAIWSDSTLASSAGFLGGPGPYTLASKDELTAMLSLSQNRHSGRDSIKVTKLADDGAGHVAVSVQYNESGRATTEALTLTRDSTDKKFGFYPYWRVVLPLGLLDLSGQPAGAVVAVDGIGLPGATALVATYVGAHKVSVGATTVFAADTEVVTANPGQAVTVNFKIALAAGAKTQAAQLVKNAFTDCAKVITLTPQNCPQNLFILGAQEPVTWTLVGDPSGDLTFGLNNNGPTSMVIGDGHFTMTVAYTVGGTPPTPGHHISGGPYEATFTVNGANLTLSGLSAGGQAANLPAPSDASDVAIKAAVLAAFKACAALTTIGSNDCPQNVYASSPSKVHWTLIGDPTAAGAKVTWDGVAGTYTVTGNFDMKVTFADAYLGPGQKADDSSAYTAHVLWTAGAAQVVWMEGR